jgi:tRNA G10  N-methylase Trm11
VIQKQAKKIERLRRRIETLEIGMNSCDNDEMKKITSYIDSNEKAALKSTIHDSSLNDLEKMEMERLWRRDMEAFKSDQERNGE